MTLLHKLMTVLAGLTVGIGGAVYLGAGATPQKIGEQAFQICNVNEKKIVTPMTPQNYDALGLKDAPPVPPDCVAIKVPKYDTPSGFLKAEHNPLFVSSTSTPL